MSARLFSSRRVMWMPLGFAWQAAPDALHCCETMSLALQHTCEQHGDPFDCPDVALVYHDPFAEYGVPIRDGGQSYLLISHCPFCGSRLPENRRDDWFDAVEAAGLDADAEDLPPKYLSAEWRAKP